VTLDIPEIYGQVHRKGKIPIIFYVIVRIGYQSECNKAQEDSSMDIQNERYTIKETY
jgi:hypothetical protein